MPNQLDMMVNALNGGGQPPPDQAMNPVGMGSGGMLGAAQPSQGAGGMGSGGMLGALGMGILPMLLQGGGGLGLLNMLKNKKDTTGNPEASGDTPSPGSFVPGGQPNPGSTSVTPF